jgi:hypothetical protein
LRLEAPHLGSAWPAEASATRQKESKIVSVRFEFFQEFMALRDFDFLFR